MPPEGPDSLAQTLRDSRDRFASGFADRCQAVRQALATTEARDEARTLVHRLTGLAGTVGFPTVSLRAGELEDYLGSHGDPTAEAPALLHALEEGFQTDLATPPEWAVDTAQVSIPTSETSHTPLLLVEDDPDQRAIMTSALTRAGFDVTGLASAETLIETAQAAKPRVIILDVILPGIDGLLACRLLKGDAELMHVPVIFVSSRSALDERLAAVALGAADYLTKPLDLSELVFRVRRLTDQAPSPSTRPADAEPATAQSYDTFVKEATKVLHTGDATLALIRTEPASRSLVADALLAAFRRRDLVGAVDHRHLAVLFPDLMPAEAVAQLGRLLESMTSKAGATRAGCAGSTAAEKVSLDALISRADTALSSARFQGVRVAAFEPDAGAAPAADSQRILLADDDPDVMRIVDAQMRALHFETVLAFDGEAAVAALEAQPCDLAVLDLMLPKLTGFEVLQRARAMSTPPRVVVLSARGREEDITRAFELGADDYVTKPFRPQELAARVARLLR